MRWRRFWIGRNRETERRRDGGETRSLLSFSVSQYHFLVAGRTVAVSHCFLGGVRGGAGDVVRSLAAVVVRRVVEGLWVRGTIPLVGRRKHRREEAVRCSAHARYEADAPRFERLLRSERRVLMRSWAERWGCGVEQALSWPGTS